MKPKIGQYVRALHDFDTYEKGEITLRAGDVIRITNVVDDNWLRGQLDCLEGNFPSNFVESISLPNVEPGQKIFVAIDEFPADEAGDLALNTGDIILGMKEIDENWWQGANGSNAGIFPLTCVRELLLDAAPRRKSFRSNTQTSCTSETPASPPIHFSEPLQARALVDVTPQIDGELGFMAGDLITIKEVIDSDWFLGEAGNKQGLVSSVCVDLLEDIGSSSNNNNHHPPVTNAGRSSLGNGHGHGIGAESPSVLHASTDDDVSRLRSLSYTSENTRSHDAEVTPYARALYTFVGQNEDELSIAEHDIVTLIQHVDPDWIEGEADGKIGLFPAAYVEIIVDCPYAYDREETTNIFSEDVAEPTLSQARTHLKTGDENKVVHESSLSSTAETDTTVTVGSNSTAICDNDKPSKTGDETTTLDSTSGLSTTGDSISNSCNAGSVASDVSSHPGSVSLGQEKFGLVLHNFSSQVAGDLSVQEGDTVTILQMLDANWIKAGDDHGRVGIVPLNHIEVIGEGPHHAPNEKQDFSIASRPGGTQVASSAGVIESAKGAQHSEGKSVQDNGDNHQVVNSICDSKDVPSTGAHRGVEPETKHLEKPKLKPKPLPKPKLAPKPVIKAKPNLHSAQPFVKPPDMSANLHVGHVVSPTEHKTFVGINSSKSLNSLIEDQLEIAKSEAKMRSRNSSVKSNDSSGSRDSDFSSKDVTASGMSDAYVETSVHSDNKVSELDAVKRESPAAANGGGDAGTDSFASLGQSNWVSFDTCEVGPRISINYEAQRNTAQPVPQEQGSTTLNSNTGIHRNSSFVNDGYVQDHIHKPSLVDVNHSHSAAAVLRPPPPVPFERSNSVQEAYKQPAKMPPVRKAPPPRPTGPKIAPAPSKMVLQPTKVNHPLPQRPAPPVPKGSVKNPAPPRPSLSSSPRRPQPRPVNRTMSNDLMSFSPEKENIEEDANSEIIADVKKRIEEVQNDLQKYEKLCAELQSKMSLVSDNEKEEIQENLEDCTANVMGLTDELDRLKETLYQLSPMEKEKALAEQLRQRKAEEEKKQREEEKKHLEEMKAKRREKRIKVIQELINTEKDFLHDLHLCLETFLGQSAERAPHLDMEMVMGNMEEIADVSQKLLTVLEGAVNGKSFDEQIIGKHFVSFAEDMKNTYAPYCRNHDDVITLLEKFDGDAEVKDFFSRKIMELREHTNVFDLKAMLIKPVQRILKYPLLLSELSKATEDDHPDKEEINRAICAMTGVATAINEYKRRKDLVFKYKKDTDQTFSDKISKLNLHSLRKKSGRIRGRLSTNLGISLVNRDENFEREEVKFRHLEKAIRIHLKNIITYMEQFQESVGSQEGFVADIMDLYDGQPSEEVTEYKAVQNKIVTDLFEEMKEMVHTLVIAPLNRLIGLCAGPNNVIEKRFDKLLDYESQLRKAKDNEKTDALLATRNDYEAMNAQLLDELPKFYSMAFKLLTDCSGVFIKAQTIFMDKALKETCVLMQLPLLLGTEDSIMETFNVRHTAELDKVSLLSFIPRGFNPKLDTLNKMDKKQKRMSWDTTMTKPNMAAPQSPQSDSQRVYLRQVYPADKLYRVSTTHKAADVMEMSLNEGHMVGLIKEQDPMGNKEKWFIDDGTIKGFFPKRLLVPWTIESVSPAGSLNSLVLGDGVDSLLTGSLMGDTASDTTSVSSFEPAMYPQLPVTPEPEPVQQHEYYCAEFAFDARSQTEVSLFEGQVVTVLSKSDLEGNTEWWYVDADGHMGYTPSAYLRKM
ncbi:LOW QUALITY PROTEIN: dynamin-binding protein-like [Gigantopelta aegis]|uniref:LOW QUALITY PROTEIN: dynamin-binding protein-like n=1 Tax=Gigantopelta aegis TaxID=1735272 RepID=UPI001B88CE34|nr:LOW QUALITY PROTEIN: dynamin-binding protein-like [Gigantopelta aegis]